MNDFTVVSDRTYEKTKCHSDTGCGKQRTEWRLETHEVLEHEKSGGTRSRALFTMPLASGSIAHR